MMAAMLQPKFGPGMPVPWFIVRSSSNPEYHFGSVAGRHIVLLFLGSAAAPASAAVHAALLAQRALFDDVRASLFVVTLDAADERLGRVAEQLPGVRIFWDLDGAVSRRFGVAMPDEVAGQWRFSTAAVLLDPSLRVMRWFVSTTDQPDFSAALLSQVESLPMPRTGVAIMQAPVLILPQVFDSALCRTLIDHYRQRGGEDSGYMKSEGGRIVGVIDHSVKRRFDCLVEDEALKKRIAQRIQACIAPEIERVFRFRATRMERYLVACYDADTGGYFRPHRDNDGDGHREFAVTINLNAEDYEGGDLRFPEYGLQTYRAPTGGACVFSCGLMHEATPVTRGQRFAFLPFLYDEAAAQRRERNNTKYVDPSVHYRYEGGGGAPAA